MYAGVHIALLFEVGVLCYLTFYQYYEFTQKTGRIVYVLNHDSDTIALYRSLDDCKFAAETKAGPSEITKWDRGSLYRRVMDKWIFTGYSYEALPVRGGRS